MADDLASLQEAAMRKIAKPHAPALATRPDIESLRKRQDDAILHHELVQEKQDRVREAIKREAPLEEQLAALGGEDSISPLQLVKLKNKIPSARGQQALVESKEPLDLARLVLGPSPSTREMERFADICLKLQTYNIRSNDRGEVVIDGYPIQGSNLGTALRYLVKGSRGFRGQVPLGVSELGGLLRQQGVASSKFPAAVRPWLGGRTGRTKGQPAGAKSILRPPKMTLPQSSDDDEVDALAQNLSASWAIDSGNDDDQQQQGSGLLNQAMDHAEQGNHDEAWDALNEARQLGVPREKLKKVEGYLSSLRD